MLVSVYMPTRNRVAIVPKAIDSVLAQTYSEIELLVVDDASSDGTQDYLRKKAESDSRVRYFLNARPLGAPASRNLALRNAAGAFCTGLDDDDQYHVDRISAFVEYWKLLTSRGVTPSCLYAQDIWLRNGEPFRTTQKRSFVSANDLFEGNYIGNQVFAPTAHFVEVGFFDEQLTAWQDLEFFIRLLQRFGRAHLLDMATYLFDASPRPGRISAQESRIRDAFETVANKHSFGLASKQKALFLQMFGEGYNVSPTLGDWIRFLGWGDWPEGALTLLRATIVKKRHSFFFAYPKANR